MKKLFFACSLIALCFVNLTFAQEKQLKVKKYFAPKYPPAAFAVRARGEVDVTVEINQDGKVTFARVENGHLLLRKACEDAAKNWTFSSDEEVQKRTEKLTFAFFVDVNSERKNYDKPSKFKTKFVKPYRIEIKGTDYYD